MTSRLPTSRAYWNLRAEQVLDRVFSDDGHVLETVRVDVNPPSGETPARQHNPSALTWPQVGMVGLGLIAVLGISGLTLQWKLTQQALERESNLALVERLRRNQATETGKAQSNHTAQAVSDTAVASSEAATEESVPGNELEISTLPNASTTLDPITIPLPSSEVSIDAPLADQPSAMAPQPLLVGVVNGGNSDGSAIFQLGDLSLSAAPGEMIGNSGWTLRSISASGAVIERAGATQSLSVGGAF